MRHGAPGLPVTRKIPTPRKVSCAVSVSSAHVWAFSRWLRTRDQPCALVPLVRSAGWRAAAELAVLDLGLQIRRRIRV